MTSHSCNALPPLPTPGPCAIFPRHRHTKEAVEAAELTARNRPHPAPLRKARLTGREAALAAIGSIVVVVGSGRAVTAVEEEEAESMVKAGAGVLSFTGTAPIAAVSHITWARCHLPAAVSEVEKKWR